MSVPSVIFVDTSIFDGQKYNFGSAFLTSFVGAVKGRGIMLLLPAPTEGEIDRHIDSQVEAALHALVNAGREARFLEKWKSWPLRSNTPLLKLELRQIARNEWLHFLTNFKVERLSYSGIDLGEVMSWYASGRAPFGPGKKRKEFPDSFALAALVRFAKAQRASVAVVAHDNDFKAACGLYTELLHYPSLPAITEALLSGDARVEKAKNLLEANKDVVASAIGEQFPLLGFYPEAEPRGDVEDVEVEKVDSLELHVVGLGDAECSVAFEAEVHYSAYVSYGDPATAIVDSSEGIYFPIAQRKGTVTDFALITGVAKLNVSSKWDVIERIGLVIFDESEVAVDAEPDEVDYSE
jgi:hypothetical protein